MRYYYFAKAIDVDGENPYGKSIPSYLWTEAVVRGHELKPIDGVVGGDVG